MESQAVVENDFASYYEVNAHNSGWVSEVPWHVIDIAKSNQVKLYFVRVTLDHNVKYNCLNQLYVWNH